MKRNLYVLISLIALASMILAACGAKPTEAPVAPVATEAPVVATEAPEALCACSPRLGSHDCRYWQQRHHHCL